MIKIELKRKGKQKVLTTINKHLNYVTHMFQKHNTLIFNELA